MTVCRVTVPFEPLPSLSSTPLSTIPHFSPSFFCHKVFWKPGHKIVKFKWKSPWEGDSWGSLVEPGFADRGPDFESNVLSALSAYSSQDWNLVLGPRLHHPHPKNNRGKSHQLDPLLEALLTDLEQGIGSYAGSNYQSLETSAQIKLDLTWEIVPNTNSTAFDVLSPIKLHVVLSFWL